MVVMGYPNGNRATMTHLPTLRVSALGNWRPQAIYREGGLIDLVDHIQRTTDETACSAI
jgi:hypothetical protein